MKSKSYKEQTTKFFDKKMVCRVCDKETLVCNGCGKGKQ